MQDNVGIICVFFVSESVWELEMILIVTFVEEYQQMKVLGRGNLIATWSREERVGCHATVTECRENKLDGDHRK